MIHRRVLQAREEPWDLSAALKCVVGKEVLGEQRSPQRGTAAGTKLGVTCPLGGGLPAAVPCTRSPPDRRSLQDFSCCHTPWPGPWGSGVSLALVPHPRIFQDPGGLHAISPGVSLITSSPPGGLRSFLLCLGFLPVVSEAAVPRLRPNVKGTGPCCPCGGH